MDASKHNYIRLERLHVNVAPRGGEIALDGAVLPVGGLLQKRVAAREAGFRRILQPRDGGYLPRDCVGVSTLQEAAEVAFADG